jgi:hypothetical protein
MKASTFGIRNRTMHTVTYMVGAQSILREVTIYLTMPDGTFTTVNMSPDEARELARRLMDRAEQVEILER